MGRGQCIGAALRHRAVSRPQRCTNLLRYTDESIWNERLQPHGSIRKGFIYAHSFSRFSSSCSCARPSIKHVVIECSRRVTAPITTPSATQCTRVHWQQAAPADELILSDIWLQQSNQDLEDSHFESYNAVQPSVEHEEQRRLQDPTINEEEGHLTCRQPLSERERTAASKEEWRSRFIRAKEWFDDGITELMKCWQFWTKLSAIRECRALAPPLKMFWRWHLDAMIKHDQRITVDGHRYRQLKLSWNMDKGMMNFDKIRNRSSQMFSLAVHHSHEVMSELNNGPMNLSLLPFAQGSPKSQGTRQKMRTFYARQRELRKQIYHEWARLDLEPRAVHAARLLEYWSVKNLELKVPTPRQPATPSHSDDSLHGVAASRSEETMTVEDGLDQPFMISWIPSDNVCSEFATHSEDNLANASFESTSNFSHATTSVLGGETLGYQQPAIMERAAQQAAPSANINEVVKAIEAKTTREKFTKGPTLARMVRARARVPVRRVPGPEASKSLGDEDFRILTEDAVVQWELIRPPLSHSLGNKLGDTSETQYSNDRTWEPSHGIAFRPTASMSAPVASASMQEESQSDPDESSTESDESDDHYVPLSYQIPEDKMAEALQAPTGSPLSWWSYDKYKSPAGETISLHYSKTKENSEKAAQYFVNKPIIGCDIEWKSSAKDADGVKNNVSVIQIACEDRIALFHIALHKGSTVDDVLAPTLKQILESPDVLKCGVAISGDFKRMQKHLGIEAVSLFEISHLHRLVKFGITKRHLVNRKLVSLAEQAKTHLGLPLYKGDERVSDWSQPLNMNQCKYAADDAYASYRIFEALKEKWYQLDPRPPFPACAELGLPIQLASLPESDAGESKDEEVASLKSQLRELVVSKAGSDVESDDSYGENLFDGLTEEQLTRLEGCMVPRTQTNEERVTYPALPSELSIEEPNSFFVGRLGLPSRLKAISGRLPKVNEPAPASTNSAPEPEQDLDTDEELEEAKVDLQAISSVHKDLYIDATRWAEETQKTSRKLSSKAKGAQTIAGLRAYYLWEHKQMELSEIAALLREKPLQTATVAAYVAECLQFGNMDFSDRGRLQTLAKQLPRQARERYWRIRKVAEGDGQASWW